MESNVAKKFTIRDPKEIPGKIIVIAILAALGFAAYVYLLPFLLSLVWNTVQLAIGIIVGGFLLYTLMNPKFWRAIKYFSEFIAQYTLGLAIDLNPFNILELKVKEAENDREELHQQTEKLKGQQAKLSDSLTQKDRLMRQSAKEMEILNNKISANPNDEDSKYLLETSSNNFSLAKDFIEKVKPIANDIDRLVAFGDKAYRKSEVMLNNMRTTIQMQRETYDAVTTGANAMRKAMKAFTGSPELNSDADKALESLRNDVANKIGVIKQAIQVTSDAMNKQDLGDAAKVAMAADVAEKLNIDKSLEYSSTITTSATKLTAEQVQTTPGNKYVGFLNQRK